MFNSCRAIALSFGYVESNSTSWLIYNAERQTPSTRKEALQSLVEYLWDKFSKEQKLSEADKFSVDAWYEYLYNLANSTCDSYGEHDWPANPYGWSPWMFDFDIQNNQMLIVNAHAEHVLTWTLAELHPELKERAINDGLDDWPDPTEKIQYNRLSDDYVLMMDESNIFVPGQGYTKGHKPRVSETVVLDYPNGAQVRKVNGVFTYVKYNTGDQVWLELKNGKYTAYKVETFDGLIMDNNGVRKVNR